MCTEILSRSIDGSQTFIIDYSPINLFLCCSIAGLRMWLCCAQLSSLLLLAGCVIGQRPTPNKRHDVYIAGFFPFGGRVSGSIPEGRVGRGVMPAVKLAVDHINENPTLLRNYRLHVWWNDTQVIESFIYYITVGPRVPRTPTFEFGKKKN